jgi:hypothetical protein
VVRLYYFLSIFFTFQRILANYLINILSAYNDGGHGRKDENPSDNPEAFAMDNNA